MHIHVRTCTCTCTVYAYNVMYKRIKTTGAGTVKKIKSIRTPEVVLRVFRGSFHDGATREPRTSKQFTDIVNVGVHIDMLGAIAMEGH